MTSAFEPAPGGFSKESHAKPTFALLRPSLTIKRRFNASPEAVYAAWTDPAKIRQWFGCSDATIIEASFDVRVGGSYAIATRKETGEVNRADGVYREIVPNRKLVFTWTPNTGLRAESIVTLLITPDGPGCFVTLSHEMFVDEETRNRHEQGWRGCFDKLERFLA
jgi:uncharacterized protein YndB with AHSA1/START domain